EVILAGDRGEHRPHPPAGLVDGLQPGGHDVLAPLASESPQPLVYASSPRSSTLSPGGTTRDGVSQPGALPGRPPGAWTAHRDPCGDRPAPGSRGHPAPGV